MFSTSIFTCIMTMVPHFAVFFIFSTSLFKFLYKYNRFLYLHMILFFFFFLELIISIACSVKYSQIMQSLLLYRSRLFPMLLNDEIVDIEKSDGISLSTFVEDKFSGLVLHPSIFSIQDLHKWCFIRFLVLIKL